MKPEKCIAVTIVPCSLTEDEYSLEDCAGCGMLEWLPAFETEQECNIEFRKMYPNLFDSNGNYIDMRSKNEKNEKNK